MYNITSPSQHIKILYMEEKPNEQEKYTYICEALWQNEVKLSRVL